MRWTIARTLFVVLALTSLLTLALNAAFNQWRFQHDFLAYTGELDAQVLAELTPAFAAHYARKGNWTDLQEDPRAWRRMLALDGPRRGARRHGGADSAGPRPPGRPPGRPPEGKGHPGTDDPLNIVRRVGLYDAAGQHIAGAHVETGAAITEAIRDGEAVVGELRLAPPVRLTNALDQHFATRQRQSLIFVALAVLALALPAALLLARRMTRPIGELAARASAITAGDYTPRVDALGSGEVADLAADLNRLAIKLEANRQARRQWISDISHELRTPLAIILAELQALEDGVRQFDEASRASLQSEASRLNRLVHDLYELSTSDEGRLSMQAETLDVKSVLADCLRKAQPRLAAAGMDLEIDFDDTPAIAMADGARLGQLFNNLIENSLRYTDAPGRLRVQAECDRENVGIAFDDSAPGVTDAQRARIFDRLFRVDPSRSRDSGGTGLGLAICSAIVAAHDGTITAAVSQSGGLSVRITLPLMHTKETQDG